MGTGAMVNVGTARRFEALPSTIGYPHLAIAIGAHRQQIEGKQVIALTGYSEWRQNNYRCR
jgi:hypothetical protein